MPQRYGGNDEICTSYKTRLKCLTSVDRRTGKKCGWCLGKRCPEVYYPHVAQHARLCEEKNQLLRLGYREGFDFEGDLSKKSRINHPSQMS